MAEQDADFEEVKENRYAHLLKPIRDLQDNFNIDLASELEEYLEQLEHAQFAFEGEGQAMVDFAEAALLIQGSAVVFSKKVEYLYNLTYQAIEAVKGRRRPDGQPEGDAGQPAAAARGRGAAAARAGDDDEDDCLDHFWNDEDLLKEMGDLDLTPEEGALPNAGLAVRPPAALLALEDHGPGGAGGTSGGKGDGDSGVYRLQQCIVHCSGALMLDPRDADMYDIQLRFIGPQPRQDKGLDQLIDAHRMEIATQPFPQPATQAHAPGPVGQQPTQDNGAAPMDQDPGQPQDFDDDDGGGGGYGGGGDWPSDDEGAPAGTEPKAAEGAASAGAADGVATTESADGRPQRRRAAGSEGGSASVGGGQQADGEAAEEEEEVFDPYKPLDPTANSRLADRPLVVRRPRKAVRSSAKAAGAGAAHGGSAAAAGGLMLAEFGYCLAFLRAGHGAKEEEEQGEGHAATQKARRDRVARARDAPAPVLDARDAAAAVAADEAAIAEPADDPAEPLAEQMPYGFDDDDGSGGYGGGGGGGSDLDDGSGPAAAGRHCFGGDGDAWHNPPGGVDGAEWPGNRELFPGMVPPMGGLGGADDPRVADGEEPSYEELCRAHMESMLMAAAAREVQSDLARRVSGWRQRIDPVLKAEESRPQFDIQEYGELILSRLSGLQITDGSQQGEAPQAQLAAAVEGGGRAGPRARIQFSRVAVQLKTFEVSRMFSAMLQLINNRNVAIHKADSSSHVPPGEVPDDPFQLELLSTAMYHKSMGARLAAPQQQQHMQMQQYTQQQAGGGDDDGENLGATQPAAARRGAGGGRGKQGGGGAKRAKRAAAEPLGDVNMDD